MILECPDLSSSNAKNNKVGTQDLGNLRKSKKFCRKIQKIKKRLLVTQDCRYLSSSNAKNNKEGIQDLESLRKPVKTGRHLNWNKKRPNQQWKIP